MGVVRALLPGDHLAAAAQLLNRQDADGPLAEGPAVAGLARVEQAARQLAQTIRVHAPARVVQSQERMSPLAPKEDRDPLPLPARLANSSAALETNSLRASLGSLASLTGDQNRLGQVPDPEPDLLWGHRAI